MWQWIKFYKIMILMLICLLGTVESFAEGEYRLTHGDAAQILCRYSGLLDRHVADDASLGTCVQLLNDIGITFELMAIIDQQLFKQSDCARVMGQLEILFSGPVLYNARFFAKGCFSMPMMLFSFILISKRCSQP